MRRATCIGAGGCLVVTVEFEPADGPTPAGYVVDGPAPSDLPCDLVAADLCIVLLTRAPGQCDSTLRAVDADGRRGEPSEPFCIVRIGADD